MGYVHELEKKLQENEHLIEEYQLKIKEWEERHEQKLGELESLISSLRKTISKQADKLEGKILEMISKTLQLKSKGEQKTFTVQKVVRMKVRVPKDTHVRIPKEVKVRVEREKLL